MSNQPVRSSDANYHGFKSAVVWKNGAENPSVKVPNEFQLDILARNPDELLSSRYYIRV